MLKIAIVENDVTVLREFRLQLESAGFHALDFASVESFIESKDFEASDFIITDLHIPGVTGTDLSEKIHSQVST